MLLPHAHVYLSEVRVNDIWLLLFLGCTWEVIIRVYVLFRCKMKPASLVRNELEHKLLQVETDYKRSLGIPAFVETSKLERALLASENALNKIYQQRKDTIERMEKKLFKHGNYILSLLIWALYFSVPIMVVVDSTTATTGEGGTGSAEDTIDASAALMKTMLFPISYVGLGNKLSRWGMAGDHAVNGIGALFVFWSSQVTTGKIMDAIDAYYLA